MNDFSRIGRFVRFSLALAAILLFLATVAAPLARAGASLSSAAGEATQAAGGSAQAAGVGWPWNVDADGVAIDGRDVVAYFEDGEAVVGSALYEAEHQGVRYRFVSAAHRRTFVAAPERYLPVCGGWDAFFCGIDPERAGFAAARWRPTPGAFRIVEGRLLLLSERPAGNSLVAFESVDDPLAMIERADAFWEDRVARARTIGALPAGMNPNARIEVAEWLSLIGDWRCEGFIMASPPGDQYVSIGTATWSFAFGFDGMVIADHWMPDVNASASGPALRAYDALAGSWKMTFVTASGPASRDWSMSGTWTDGELHADLSIDGGSILGKVRFFDIGAESFRWSSSRSFDAGATWIEDFQYTNCRRAADSER